MVTTRQHPTDFMPPPPPLPTKTSSATSPSSETSSSHILTHGDTPSNQDLADPFPSSQNATWTHTPSNLTLLWLLISLPLVLWDTGYVFLRPHSMPGGSFHAPIWTPYALYGTIDHIYGWPAWEKHNGFTAAQASLNVVETVGYGVYLYLVWMYGREVRAKGRGAPKAMEGKGRIGELAQARSVAGRMGAWAVLIGFGTALMTVSKTVLYWLNEAFSGFENIGHNDASQLLFLWIIPNGAWLVLPTYMTYVFGREILQGLEIASRT